MKPEREHAETPPAIGEVLGWLPADTETVQVTRGPYPMEPAGQWEPEDRPLDRRLESMSYQPLKFIENGAYLKHLLDCELTLAVQGSRCFRPPQCFGMWLSDGCRILVFAQPIPGSLRQKLLGSSAKVRFVEGHEVFCYELNLEGEHWTFFITQPRPNVLLVATHEGYLQEVLRRMQGHTGPRAFPENLPEWKYVAPGVRFWAIRRFPLQSDEAGPPEGLVFTFDPDGKTTYARLPRVRHLPVPESDIEAITNEWTYIGEATWLPRVEHTEPGVIEISAEFKQTGDVSRFYFLLLSHLGHVITC